MHFLPDIYVPCDQCKGKRYNRETLEIKYKGKTIHEVLDMTIEEAREFFDAVPALARKLQTLMDVGLTYIRLGQSATTLSGGEAQRVKLARELSKRGTGQTLYILDEPTTGLHFADIQQLLDVLHKLRDQGNTIVVIEHNLDVIKTADWIVDRDRKAAVGRRNPRLRYARNRRRVRSFTYGALPQADAVIVKAAFRAAFFFRVAPAIYVFFRQQIHRLLIRRIHQIIDLRIRQRTVEIHGAPVRFIQMAA